MPNIENAQTNIPLRYGDHAIDLLVKELQQLTGHPASMFVAKIIGGAENVTTGHASQKVGSANVAIAREKLRKYKIKILSEEVGGSLGRKILFCAKTGRLESTFIPQE